MIVEIPTSKQLVPRRRNKSQELTRERKCNDITVVSEEIKSTAREFEPTQQHHCAAPGHVMDAKPGFCLFLKRVLHTQERNDALIF